MALEFGLDTFGDVTRGADGALLPQAQVIRDVVEQAALADDLGVDVIGVGEHHRADFAVSAPEIVLAAIAGRTRRIRLASAVTVLSTDDPVRVFQRFSTLNAVSGGRAEVILGRGSFTESYPLFGYDLADYAALFEDKLDRFVALLRPAQDAPDVYPPVEGALAAWVGVGGSPDSVVRVARHDLPMMLAIIGGAPARFRPLVDLYHRAVAHLGRPARAIGVHSGGHVAATDAQAREELWPDYKLMRDRIGAERGWPPVDRAQFESEVGQGALFCGSPETVARKIAATAGTLGLSRFHLKYSAGALPHAALMRSIELYGRRVVPLARDMLGEAA
jgi:probable LLM family oxidoreductase